MKKGMLIIAILLTMSLAKQVKANTVRSYTVSNTFDNWTGAKVHNWTSSSNYSEMTVENDMGYFNTLEDTNTGEWISTIIDNIDVNVSNVGNNGISISISSNNTYLSNEYYTITAYYCTMNNVVATLSNIYVGSDWTPYSNNVSKNIITNTGLQSGIFEDFTHTTYQYCRATSGYFYTTTAGNVIALKFTTSNTSGWFTFLGYKTTAIKPTNYLTESQLNSAISNSGLATASSVAQIQQEMDDVNDTLTEDHTYNNNASQQIDGEDEIDDMSQAQEDLMDSIDLSGASNVDITINPNASSYIWQIVNRLRNMNSSIIILMTSILGLGILKLVLNR